MNFKKLAPADLRHSVAASAFGFASTAELLHQPLPWIGQERAEQAARFGLAMAQAGYNLFVLGEVGSGRTTLLSQMMRAQAATRPVPPDLCYLHNFDVPEQPRALRLPAGNGRLLRQQMAQLAKNLQTDIPKRLAATDFKSEADRIEQAAKAQEDLAYAELSAFADARHFSLLREAGNMVFTLKDGKGKPVTSGKAMALTREQRLQIDTDEADLRDAISRHLGKTSAIKRSGSEQLAALRRPLIEPMLEDALQEIRSTLQRSAAASPGQPPAVVTVPGAASDAMPAHDQAPKPPAESMTPAAENAHPAPDQASTLQPKGATPMPDEAKLGAYLDQIGHAVLENLELFEPTDDEEPRLEALLALLSDFRVNVAVDNQGLTGAPVIIEDNPQCHTLFGSIDYESEDSLLVTDFSRIRAGSLLKAHGGFLMLHLRDLLADELAWEKLRRFLRSGRLQIEEPGMLYAPMPTMSLQPEPVAVTVKIVLIATVDEYYAVQEGDPEFARRFLCKVDFAESFRATPQSCQSTAIFVAHTCQRLDLLHFGAAAVAAVVEETHRQAEDQTRQSAIFSVSEALVVQASAQAQDRGAALVEPQDVQAAKLARVHRHNYPEQRLQETLTDGERLLDVSGAKVAQLNGLTVLDLGDYQFGFPVRVTARTYAGEEGLLNIEREVELSGPIHDKGVLILHSYLSGLFAHIAPLAMNASVVFEQEYSGVEGDSASCAEFYALLSSLSGLPLKQGIAVTGAVNQHGEMLPVGGINEKIEGYFKSCELLGLDGTQGVLIPSRNRRHLMLDAGVVEAVALGRFHIYTATQASEGMELLTGVRFGSLDVGGYAADTVLGMAQKTLQKYRHACENLDTHPPERHGRKHWSGRPPRHG